VTRAEARQALERLVEEAAEDLDEDDAAWLLGRWRRFDATLDTPAVEVHMGPPAPPEVRFVPVPVEGPLRLGPPRVRR
jgi:hypothetical protein